jgi:hypothetical protein
MTRRFFCKVLLVVVAIFGVLALSSVLSAQGNRENAFERVREVQDRHTDWLMAIDGVEGTAIGFNPNARLSVTVLLERPGVGGIPQELEGVAVHPVVTGKIYALPKPDNPPGLDKDKNKEEPVDPTAWFGRPVPIGVSTGNIESNSAGTIACRIMGGGNVYALSNNHVYALENMASQNSKILQPGVYDGGGTIEGRDDVIGTLYASVDIDFYDPENPPQIIPTNEIDAAIALSSIDNLDNSTPSDGYGTPKSTTAAAYLNQPVKKYGRTTGLTKGRVYAINATVDVGYDSGVARFVNQIVISPGSFSAPGDSGSLVVVDGKGRNKAHNRKPVGLLFAGSDFFTIANPIDSVLDEFGFTIDGEQ